MKKITASTKNTPNKSAAKIAPGLGARLRACVNMAAFTDVSEEVCACNEYHVKSRKLLLID